MIPIEKPNFSVTESLIKIDGKSIPLGAGRDIEQSYDEEQLGNLERSLDGGLVFLGIPDLGFRINTSISGEGLFTPHVFGLRQWNSVIMECELPWELPGWVDPVNFPRPHVDGSIRYYGLGNNGPVTIGLEGMAESANVLKTTFRPKLRVNPIGWSMSGRAWSKRKQWRWDFREDTVIV